MTDHRSKDPLHGVTLEMILLRLVERYGWEELARDIRIRCFTHNPSIKSSLAFLRKTPWARKKVEELYVWTVTNDGGPEKRGPADRPGGGEETN